MQIFKHLLYTIILFFTLSSHSAPSDCLQLEADGTVNCIPSTVQFTNGGNSPRYNTVEELISTTIQSICNGYVGAYECYAQYQNFPVYPPPGREKCSNSPTCNEFINYSPNQTQNSFRIVATVLNNTFPYYSDKHFQRAIVGYRLMSCPSGMTAITNGGGTTPYTVWCKPTNIQFEPTQCNDNCNISGGDASY